MYHVYLILTLNIKIKTCLFHVSFNISEKSRIYYSLTVKSLKINRENRDTLMGLTI